MGFLSLINLHTCKISFCLFVYGLWFTLSAVLSTRYFYTQVTNINLLNTWGLMSDNRVSVLLSEHPRRLLSVYVFTSLRLCTGSSSLMSQVENMAASLCASWLTSPGEARCVTINTDSLNKANTGTKPRDVFWISGAAFTPLICDAHSWFTHTRGPFVCLVALTANLFM